ncbi:hypothetical protein Caci_3219 [Catenulispora acidiphila DSM 44928]|uniref:Uncharacterized protein n=1 Tax=Catenulispora acidiphila (strain DSM 44928 / JCM 14897 / NBRC 102108 / NRRL B-24433 / ID139908) TaxID=479433 RepID=C7Q6C0_CATAD|nr:hypothetical protein [Catenulispora acidiphila]ACU72126.1 hypothetical protein Caci_3219 [Catenulispora acidiphila DSM 44928]
MRMRSLTRSAAGTTLAAALAVGLAAGFTSPADAQDAAASLASLPASSATPSSAPSPAHTGCDPIAGTACLLPFPDDWYTRPDHSIPTGRRIDFTASDLPVSALAGPADPTAWNRLDGFSPGSALVLTVPGLDLAASGLAPVTDIGRSLVADAPIVIIDETTGARWPYWAEIDANDPQHRALLVHPARDFLDGHHYAVGIRNLRSATGAKIPAPAPFARILSHQLPKQDPLSERQRELKPVLTTLRRNGVRTSDLYLAWDFTVASTASLTGDLTSIRDNAFARLGSAAPTYTVTSVTDLTATQDPNIARVVEGTIQLPSYLSQPGGPTGSVFNRGPNGRPAQLPGNIQTADFRCEIPRAAWTKPSQAALYGHGLLGSRNEVGSGNVKAMAGEHDFTFCATDWIGMAADDPNTVIAALANLSAFPEVTERTQQGVLNALFLGRDLVNPAGFAASPAFRTADGRSLLDSRAGVVYDGNSQGGILGGVLVAVSPDVKRAVLGVTAMNYSILLNRSVDFTELQPALDAGYPDKLQQQIVFQLMQMLWDHAETDGYAQHLTDGHEVLMDVAFGDHQVANVAADVEARTIGARLHVPALASGRSPDTAPYWGIAPMIGPAYKGSAMVVWDSGTPPAPLTNTAPTGPQYGHDPHEDPRNSPAVRLQKAVFLTTGVVIDVCGSAPCAEPPVS